MAFTLVLKTMLSMAVSLVFWFWAFLVFMVYAFMPASKLPNSIIFAVVAPIIYLALANFIIKKLFKETGWKSYLINFAVTLLTMGLSLLVIDLTAKSIK